MKKKMTKKCKVGDIIKMPNDRKHSLWVVLEAVMTGGGNCHNDTYPDAWHVTVQRMSEDDELIGRKKTFTQETNCYNNCIPEVEVIGKWQKPFQPVNMKELVEWMCYYNPVQVLRAMAGAFEEAAGRTGLGAYKDLAATTKKTLPKV